jgi:hypothetical protein
MPLLLGVPSNALIVCSMLSPRLAVRTKISNKSLTVYPPDMFISRWLVKQSMADSNVLSSVNAGVGDNEVGVVVMAVFVLCLARLYPFFRLFAIY